MISADKILNSKFMERFRRKLAIYSGMYCKIKRLSPSAHEDVRTVKLLQHFKVDTLIDVGANTGQFAESMYDFGYKGKIISFEPVKGVYEQLVKRSRRYPNWTVADRMAIGATDGEIEVNVSESTVFSSILKIKDEYVSATRKSRIIDTEKVSIHRLDTIIEQYVSLAGANVLLKIDTQGYEKEVVAGSSKLLQQLTGIKIEIPLYMIYENTSWAFFEIVDFMKTQGFYPYAISPEGVNWTTGRMNTVDGIFFK